MASKLKWYSSTSLCSRRSRASLNADYECMVSCVCCWMRVMQGLRMSVQSNMYRFLVQQYNIRYMGSYAIDHHPRLPVALPALPRLLQQSAPAVLLALVPVALVDGTVGVLHSAEPVLEVPLVVALVGFALWPDELALSVHLIIVPLPLVLPAIAVLHDPVAVLVVVFELAHVLVSVGPFELALAVFLVVLVDPLEVGTIGPCLLALPVPLIAVPLALKYSLIGRDVLAAAVRLIIPPVSNVDVAIGVKQPADTLCLIKYKLSRVGGLIREIELAVAVFLPLAPLPEVEAVLVDLAGWQYHGIFVEWHLGWRAQLVDHRLELDQMHRQLGQGVHVTGSMLLDQIPICAKLFLELCVGFVELPHVSGIETSRGTPHSEFPVLGQRGPGVELRRVLVQAGVAHWNNII